MTYIKVHHERLQQMEKALKESGWQEYPTMGEFKHYNHMDTHVQHTIDAEYAARKEVLSRIDELMDVLGLREEYPDTITEMREDTYYSRQTHHGAHKFLEDIHAAYQASESNEALARIRSVLGKK